MKVRKPIRRAVGGTYGGPPFGPFIDPGQVVRDKQLRQDPKFITDSGGPIDMRGQQEWLSIWIREVRSFAWGQVQVDVNCNNPTGVVFQESVHCEVRVLGYIAGQVFTMAEDACGNHLDRNEELSPGPFRFVIFEGDMPDQLELQARARRGGIADPSSAASDATETLILNFQVRFHQ